MASKGGSSIVVGYKYYLDMLMSIGRGPMDALVQINLNDLPAWTGVVDHNQTFQLDADHIFGGDEKEGGVSGPIIASFGDRAQVPDAAIAAAITAAGQGPVSNLRGIFSLFFSGHICSNNPYPKAWSFRVQRCTSGWMRGTARAPDTSTWYPAEAAIPLTDSRGIANGIRAMNPAHILVECLTNPVWGRGLPFAALDETSFISAANTFCLENFGLCLKWSRDTDLQTFVQLVIDHIGGALYCDRNTGLMTLKLLRNDYDPLTLPVFDYSSGLLQILDDTQTATDNSFNELIVNWTDPVTSNGKRQTRIQNLAAITATQSLSSKEVDYWGLPTADLADRVAQRDMATMASGLKRFQLKMDRRARLLSPGSVFRIAVPDRGITNMVLRVGQIKEMPVTDGSIQVNCVQDRFSLPQTTYLITQPGTFVPPDRSAVSIATRRVEEINYRDVVRVLSPANLAQVTTDQGGVVSAAEQPSSFAVDYVFRSKATGEAFADHGAFGWTPTGLLADTIDHYETSISMTNFEKLGQATIPGVAWLGSECVHVTALDLDTGEMTIGRGCVDTVPVPHNSGERIWFVETALGSDGREYTFGETVSVVLVTRTNTDIATGAPTDLVDIEARQGKPYPPADVQVNGVPYGNFTHGVGDLAITFVDRNRVTQNNQVLVHGDAGVTPEAGTTYILESFTPGAVTLINTYTGYTSGAPPTYDSTMDTADGNQDPVTLKLWTMRDGMKSYQPYTIVVARTTSAGFDYDFDNNFNG